MPPSSSGAAPRVVTMITSPFDSTPPSTPAPNTLAATCALNVRLGASRVIASAVASRNAFSCASVRSSKLASTLPIAIAPNTRTSAAPSPREATGTNSGR